MIMDTLGAFALSTEPPLESVIKNNKPSKDNHILTGAIWRQIIGISLWNTIVCLVLIFAGPLILTADLDYTLTDSANDNDAKRRHMKYLFNTFVSL